MTAALPEAAAPVPDCWNHIGVWGDGTCPELAEAVHCQNCPVYVAAGRTLLNRPAPRDYLDEWSHDLAQPEEARLEKRDSLSVVIFRVNDEWLALDTTVFREATPVLPIHSLPHRGNDVLIGLVNVRGELLPCFSLARLVRLEAGEAGKPASRTKVYPRMAVIEKEARRSVFPVDEVLGAHTIRRADLEPPPATLSKAENPFTSHLFSHGNRNVALLDGELFFYHLQKVCL